MSQVTYNRQEIMSRLMKAANQAVFEAAGVGAEHVQSTLMGGPRFTSSRPGQPPNFQRGTLAGSVSFAHPDSLGTPLRAKVGIPKTSMHGVYMEHGAYVRAKSGKFLPVPVNTEARRLLESLDGRSLRTSGRNLQVQKATGGALLLVEKTNGGKEKKNGAVFILKSAVRILPRPWLRPGMTAARTMMAAKFSEVFEREAVFA